MARRRRGLSEPLNPWPGYVDALSTLLMVIIFVLLVFVLSQGFMSVALSGRDRALDRLNRQVAELTDMLSLERGRTGELQESVSRLNQELTAATEAREQLGRALSAARDAEGRVEAERDALRAEKEGLAAQFADAALQEQSLAARNEQLQRRVTQAAERADQAGQEAAALAGPLAETRQALAAARTQVEALAALKRELERQAQDAAVRATTAEERARAVAAQLADEKSLGESARAQMAALSQQIDALRERMAQLAAALEATQKTGREKDAEIENLGSKLNAALASKVQELQRYRSEFFGRLREVLAGRPGIRVVGDRFVFQSEVLFPAGSADLTPQGEEQMRTLATTLKSVTEDIPQDVNWVLRVDGHADKQALAPGGRYATNWELSAQRAINVVKLLVSEGVPPSRLAATGFGEFQPLDAADTAEAYARNRRIEIRLTDR